MRWTLRVVFKAVFFKVLICLVQLNLVSIKRPSIFMFSLDFIIFSLPFSVMLISSLSFSLSLGLNIIISVFPGWFIIRLFVYQFWALVIEFTNLFFKSFLLEASTMSWVSSAYDSILQVFSKT